MYQLFGKFICRKICPSENVVVGIFGVGKNVSENLVSENLLSEKPPDTEIMYQNINIFKKNCENYFKIYLVFKYFRSI